MLWRCSNHWEITSAISGFYILLLLPVEMTAGCSLQHPASSGLVRMHKPQEPGLHRGCQSQQNGKPRPESCATLPRAASLSPFPAGIVGTSPNLEHYSNTFFSQVQKCFRQASLSMTLWSTSSVELSACLLNNSHSGRTVSLSSVSDKNCVCMPSEDVLTLYFPYALALFHTNPHLPVFLSGCCNLSVCGGLPTNLAAQFVLGD